ncbi:MAG: SMP-30/gluconolactonase/LRE family protein [Novosphingobium sp.]|nr:SMP-30/gluconolactonase/LRE family protein [Novosphingobium sp.]
MLEASGRNTGSSPATPAEGWGLNRLTQPSRLFGANGLRTGTDGRIYVAQCAGSQVSAIDPDTGEVEVISPIGGEIIGPDDLVFDEDGNLYLTEITENQVKMLKPNGESQVVWGDMPVANPITYHQGHLIAGECRVGARIMELDRDGGEPRVILDDIPMVNAFDFGPDGKLYFPVMGMNEIWKIDINGGEPEVVAKDLGVPDSVKFHPDGYIVSTQVHSGQVLKIDPKTGEQSVLADIGPGLDNCTFVDGRTFVSHITGSLHEIIEPGKARPLVEQGLQWPLGLAVGEAGEVFVADGGFTYTLAPGGEMQLAGMLFTEGFPGWVRDAVSAGPGEWFVTTANGDVARWNPSTQQHEMLASGYDRLVGIDRSASGALVVAEMPTGRVLSVESGNVEELATGLDTPMGVVVALDGTVYVSESGAGRVVRLSGGKAETVIDGLGRPEGIAISGNRLIVVDVKAKQLVSCDLSGGARQTLVEQLPVGTPSGATAKPLGAVGDMCGPMVTFTGVAAGGDGTLYVAANAEGSVLSVSPA